MKRDLVFLAIMVLIASMVGGCGITAGVSFFLEVTVNDEDGLPLAGAVVIVGTQQDETDEQGKAHFWGLRGENTVEASKDGYQATQRQVLIAKNASVVLELAFRTYEVMATSDGGTVTGAGLYRAGDQVELVAVPDAGFQFTRWVGDGDLSTENPYRFTMPAVDLVLVAVFDPVEAVEPLVSDWPVPSDIIYGDSLQQSALQGGGAETVGRFVWQSPEEFPDQVGLYQGVVEFVPEDGDAYFTVTNQVEVAVMPRELVIAVLDLEKTEGQSYTFLGNEYSVEGLVFSDAVTSVTLSSTGFTPEAVTGQYTVFIDGAVGNGLANYSITYIPGLLLVVDQPIPQILAAPTVSITYGQNLDEGTFIGGEASVPGEFIFVHPTIRPHVGTGLYQAAVRFLPDDPQYRSLSLQLGVAVNPKVLTIAAQSQSKAYGEDDPVIPYEIVSGTLVGDDRVGGLLGRELGEDAGRYEISLGSLNAGNNYELVLGSAWLTIEPIELQVSVEDAQKVYGQEDPDFTVSYSGFAFSDGPNDLAGGLQFEREQGETVGSYQIYVTGLESPNYTIESVPGTLFVHPADLVITANDIQIEYGDPEPLYGVTYRGWVLDDDSSALTGALSFQRLPGQEVGRYPITVAGVAAENYRIRFVSGELTIAQRQLVVQIDNVSKFFGDLEPDLTYQLISGTLLAGDEFVGALRRDIGEDVGVYPINQGSLSLDEGYSLTVVPGQLTVKQRLLRIAVENAFKTYGDQDPDFDYRILEGAPESEAVLSGRLRRQSGEDVGVYPITQGTLTAGPNFDLVVEPGELEIRPRPLTITGRQLEKSAGESYDPDGTEFRVEGLVFLDQIELVMVDSPGFAPEAGIDQYSVQLQDAVITTLEGTVTIYSFGPLQGVDGPANYVIDYGEGLLSVRPAVTPELVAPPIASAIVYGQSIADSLLQNGEVMYGGDQVFGTFVFDDPDIVPSVLLGTYRANVTFVPDDLESFNRINLRVNVPVRQQTIIIAPSDHVKVFGARDPDLDFVIVSGELEPGDFFTGELERAPGEDVGEYPIRRGTLDAGTNYTIEMQPAVMHIEPATVIIIPDRLQTVYGQPDPELTFQTWPQVTVTGALGRESGHSVGEYAFHLGTLNAGANYQLTLRPADNVFRIVQQPLLVQIDNVQRAFGDPDPVFTYTLLEGALVPGDSFSGAPERESGDDIGIYRIGAGDLTAGSNYDLTVRAGELTVGRRILQIVANSGGKVYGDSDPELTYEVIGELVAEDVLTGALAREPGEAVRSYRIRQGDLSTSDNYLLHFTPNNFTIDPRPLIITPWDVEKVEGQAYVFVGIEFDAVGLVGEDAISSVVFSSVGAGVDGALGAHPIYASDAMGVGLRNYAIHYEEGTLVVLERRLPTIEVLPEIPAITYNNRLATTELVGGVAVDGAQLVDGIFYFEDDAVRLPAGVHLVPVRFEPLDLAQYQVVELMLEVVVRPRALEITADSQVKNAGEVDPALTYRLTGGVLAVSDALTGTLQREPGEAPGSYRIEQGTLSAGENYSITYVEAFLIIHPVVPSIVSIAPASSITVEYGTTEADAIAALATTTTITDSNGDLHTVVLAWSLENYDGVAPGAYGAVGVFELPSGVTQSEPLTVLEVRTEVNVEAHLHTVTFRDHDGSMLSQQTVPHGGAADAPTAPFRAGYRFIGWDRGFSAVTESITVWAVYESLGLLMEEAGLLARDSDGILPYFVIQSGMLRIETPPLGARLRLPHGVYNYDGLSYRSDIVLASSPRVTVTADGDYLVDLGQLAAEALWDLRAPGPSGTPLDIEFVLLGDEGTVLATLTVSVGLAP